jgi:hypothetical protein
MRPLSRHAGVILLASLVGLVLSTWTASGPAQAAPTGKGKSRQTPNDFQYELSDCLESHQRDSVGLIVSDDSVRFDHVFTMNCIAATRPDTVKVLYSKKGRELEVSIVLRSPVLSDCTCPIGIQGKIGSLKKGTYRLSFVYDSKVGDAANEKPTRESLGGKEFTIN